MDRGNRGGARETLEARTKAVLESPGMSGPLAAALRPLGLKPASWRHLRSHHRPGAGTSALYRVDAVPRSGAAPAVAPLRLQVGATTAPLTGADAGTGTGMTARGTVDGISVRLWVHPRDPVLSGLPWATNSGDVARHVFGARSADARASLRLVAYRPLRRAVVQATYRGTSVYLKVPQPRQAAAMRQRFTLAAAAGLPVPALLETAPAAGSAADGILVLAALPGRSLHRELRAGGPEELGPRAVSELLDQLPAAALALPRRSAWSDRILDYAAGAVLALPDDAARISRCARSIDESVRSADPGPVVPVHGDFHGGNLLAGRSSGKIRISGMLDVDALGPGHRVDDLACFLGHLLVLSVLTPENGALRTAAAACARGFAGETDPAALYSRTAAVALTLVAGASARGTDAAYRTLGMAEELLERSRGPF